VHFGGDPDPCPGSAIGRSPEVARNALEEYVMHRLAQPSPHVVWPKAKQGAVLLRSDLHVPRKDTKLRSAGVVVKVREPTGLGREAHRF
jgi:hypothetical protein